MLLCYYYHYYYCLFFMCVFVVVVIINSNKMINARWSGQIYVRKNHLIVLQHGESNTAHNAECQKSLRIKAHNAECQSLGDPIVPPKHSIAKGVRGELHQNGREWETSRGIAPTRQRMGNVEGNCTKTAENGKMALFRIYGRRGQAGTPRQIACLVDYSHGGKCANCVPYHRRCPDYAASTQTRPFPPEYHGRSTGLARATRKYDS